MRIVFMGTPEFAVPSLRALVESGYEVGAVLTQPGRPKNRGMKLQEPPVKILATELRIPVHQPENLKDGTAYSLLKEQAPDLIVVVAYGKILPKEILDYPKLGCINVHSSLLPKYRGAAPIHWAILNGEEKTGVTIMHMAAELDAGDIIRQSETPIEPEETADELQSRLAEMGAALLVSTVKEIADGKAKRIPQNPDLVSFAPMLNRALSPISWSRTAMEIHNQVRGLQPWPGTTTELGGHHVKIWRTRVLPEEASYPPGTVLRADKQGIAIVCGDGGVLLIEELQAQGKKRVSAADYLRGNPL